MQSTTNIDWAIRVIPLPQEMRFTGAITTLASEVCLLVPDDDALTFAREVLNTITTGGTGCRYRLRLELSENAALHTCPNSEQAYMIRSTEDADGGEWVLTALTPVGLLNAARTFHQLVTPHGSTLLEFPLGELRDWPDLAERGEWGGNSATDFAWLAARKYNVVEVPCGARCNAAGEPVITLTAAEVAEAARQGITVIPILIHLEQLATGGLRGWEACYSVPDQERAQRSDYIPGLCMSHPRTEELIELWLTLLARLSGVTEIMVWLSEESTPCYCPRCRGQEPFALEVAAIVAGFRRTQATVNPELKLRLLTTQGSYPVNDRVLAATPSDVRVSYYDGGRTYDSSHSEMIYPLLEDYAGAGHWLGVYPQVTHAWRAVWPWTGSQFINFRLQEFTRKQLSCIIGYAVPSNRYHEFNVTAAAEWGWNANGRSPYDFARAYAYTANMADPDAYAAWTERIGPSGWDLAASRLLLRMIYDPGMGLGTPAPPDHRFEGGPEVFTDAHLAADIADARAAREMARNLGEPDAEDESVCVLTALEMLRTLYRLSMPGTDAEVAGLLVTLDRCAAVINTRLLAWGRRVAARAGTPLPSRLMDTMLAPVKTAACARRILGTPRDISDPHAAYRAQEIGRWSEIDFADASTAVLHYDATPAVTAPGLYAVGFEFIDSASGMTPHHTVITIERGGEPVQTLHLTDDIERASMWDRYGELYVTLDDLISDDRISVEIDAEGPPAAAPHDRRSCEGIVTLRRVWLLEELDESDG